MFYIYQYATIETSSRTSFFLDLAHICIFIIDTDEQSIVPNHHYSISPPCIPSRQNFNLEAASMHASFPLVLRIHILSGKGVIKSVQKCILILDKHIGLAGMVALFLPSTFLVLVLFSPIEEHNLILLLSQLFQKCAFQNQSAV